MKKNVLITGGAGFIGQALVNKLLEKDYSITILDNLDFQVHGHNVPIFDKDIHFIKGDILDDLDLKKAFKGQDVLIHLAAHTATGQSMYAISNDLTVNVLGTAKIMEYLLHKSHGIQKMILASSRAVYGEGAYLCANCGFIYPFKRSALHMQEGLFEHFCPRCKMTLSPVPTKESYPLNPLSIYGSSKVAAEQIFAITAQNLELPYTILRYQNVYGPGQSLSNPYTGILSVFANRILNNKPIYIFEDGKESRDFVYIDDVTYATVQVIENHKTDNKIYNIGSGSATSILGVAKLFFQKFNLADNYIITGRYRLGDIRHSLADITMAKQDFAYCPQIDIGLGIKKYINWLKTQKIPKDDLDISLQELEKHNMLGGNTHDIT